MGEARTYSDDMTTSGMGGLVGELVLSDASLSALLSDMRTALTRYGSVPASPTKTTTGQLADELLGIDKRHPTLLPPGFRPWLIRVKAAAEQRNAIVHAIGRDRCVACGRSSVFEHKHKPVDRSEQRLRGLITDVEMLITEGIEFANDLSGKLNELLLGEANARARATSDPQFPDQINIVGGWNRCGSCSTDGQAKTMLKAPPATAVLPPGTDIRRLFGG